MIKCHAHEIKWFYSNIQQTNKRTYALWQCLVKSAQFWAGDRVVGGVQLVPWTAGHIDQRAWYQHSTDIHTAMGYLDSLTESIWKTTTEAIKTIFSLTIV